VLLLCTPGRSFAHKDDYIDETLVYVTVERSEWELEYWFDLGRISTLGSESSRQDFTRHNFALEHGLTDHLMLDGRLTISKLEGQPAVFDSGRLEGRYRFGEEGERPVDIAASAEINTERDENGKQVFGLEPRLILSKDIKAKLNLTLNVPLEIQPGPGSVELVPSFGLRYNASDPLRLGFEARYNSDSRQGAFIPQIWFIPKEGFIIKVALALGLDRNEANFGRIALEAEF
jgi:hypothetical protein